MASPADAIAYAAHGGWDTPTVWYVNYFLQTGQIPDGASPQAIEAIHTIGGMGLSSTGVSQLRYYLENGSAPADLSYVDESEQVLNPAPTPADVPAANPAAPTAPAAPNITDPAQSSARAYLNSLLDEWGLQGLGDQVWNDYLNGTPVDALPQTIRDSDQYKTRFAGMASLQEKGRAITEAQYIATERTFAQIMRAAGLPSGLFDSPDDFATLIGGEVAPTEFASRLETYNEVLYQSPAAVRDELSRIYGVTEGQMLAFMIDPDRTQQQIQTQVEASRRSAAAARSGFGGLNQGEAEGLVQLGVSEDQARSGFGALVESKELFQSLDAGESEIGRGDQLAGVFGGNANAKRRIEDRARRRVARFEGGGSYARSEEGFSGIGSAG